MATLAITFTSPELQNKAQQIAKELHLPLCEFNTIHYDYFLVLTPVHLELQIKKENFSPLFIDFLSGKNANRQKYSKNELIAKAVGLKGNYLPSVIDATAGLGRDGFLLASLGCPIVMLERSPILFALLRDALERLQLHSSLAAQFAMQLIYTDAKIYLNHLSQEQFPEVILLDPMYPKRTKSALVKKEMRILRDLLGDDSDIGDLFALALKKAKKRVVIKRPHLAPYLNECKPHHSIIGKNTRFDVYATHLEGINRRN